MLYLCCYIIMAACRMFSILLKPQTILMLFPLLLQTMAVSAQKEQYIWIFGGKQGYGIDFNGSAPVVFRSNFQQHEGCASICDANGQLLFYTDGNTVYNRNQVVMPDGNLGLEACGLFPLPVFSITQPAVIMEAPGRTGVYYVFSNVISSRCDYLYWHTIDMQQDNGLGNVIQKDSVYLPDRTEQMTVVNGDSCNFWVVVTVTKSSGAPEPGLGYAFEVTQAGINRTPVISNAGMLGDYVPGVIKFSPDRRKMVMVCSYGSLSVFDFDPATGILSNQRILEHAGRYYGACFSPDNSKLYVEFGQDRSGKVYQYDFDASLSKYDISPNETMETSGDMKIGPDNRIYHIAGTMKNDTVDRMLNVIMYPNLPGTACQYTFKHIILASYAGDSLGGSLMGMGLPNDVGISKAKDTIARQHSVRICFRDSFRIGVLPGKHYYWNTGATTDSIVVSAPGWYVARYWVSCTYYVDSIYVSIASGALPELYASSGNSCPGTARDTAIIRPAQNDTVRYAYRWYSSDGALLRQSVSKNTADTLAGIPPGAYRIQITTAAGCDTSLDFTITAPAPYNAAFETDSFLCEGQRCTFHNISAGSFTQWAWDFGDGETDTQSNPEHIYGRPGVYRVRLIAASNTGCSDTAWHTVTVDSFPYLRIMPDRDHICAGETVTFHTAYRSGADSLVWQWTDGHGMQSGHGPVYSFENPGIYSVTITAFYPHCPDTAAQDTIYVARAPLVNIGMDTTLCPGNAPLRLVNLEEGRAGDRYRWSTGAATAAISVHEPGIYWLQVISDNECMTTDSVTIHRSCYLDIPNVFTPNGDGINDYFFPREMTARGITRFHMQVFNRWGQLVYETRQTAGYGWNGTVNGLPASQGVFVYLVEAAFENGRQEKYEGNVTLLR